MGTVQLAGLGATRSGKEIFFFRVKLMFFILLRSDHSGDVFFWPGGVYSESRSRMGEGRRRCRVSAWDRGWRRYIGDISESQLGWW